MSSGLQITVHGGAGEIGGNKILVADSTGTRILLDFGQSFTAGNDYFSGYLQPRAVNGAGDYFEFGLLPEVPGLYAREALQNTTLRYRAPQIDAILVSHAHSDHVSALRFIDPTIPVYLGATTHTILTALAETSWQWDLGPHDYRPFRTGDKLHIDSFTVEPIHVDHSIPGAYGFLIHARDAVLAYTGDLRLHGPAAHMTEDFAARVGEAHPDLLLCEGTRLGGPETVRWRTERDVLASCRRAVANARHLALTTFYGRDLDRINTLRRVARATKRTFVVGARVAHLLDRLQGDPKLSVPRVGREVLVYLRRKDTYYSYERAFVTHAVGHRYIRRHQPEILLQLDWTNLTELIDLQPTPGALYVHSMSEPFNEEGEAEMQILQNWLHHFHMELHQAHASGHASPRDLRAIIAKCRPKQVVPIHTEHPEAFPDLVRGLGVKVRYARRGRPLSLTRQ
jgi:ribonuclease J